MGNGASVGENLDEVAACTYLLSRAIAAISFPDMHRIYDFDMGNQSKESKVEYETITEGGVTIYRIKPRPLLEESTVNDTEGEPKKDSIPDLVVKVGEDEIKLKNLLDQNNDGWHCLHACCHTNSTADAGIKIIDYLNENKREEVEKTKFFDKKTIKGPGAFNSEWSALHMAAAYGVEKLVEKLIAVGANVNCQNSISWTPLHEACHRGYIEIIKQLVSAGANLSYIPDEVSCKKSPFLRAPAQSPLGEVSRCGFKEACRTLLEFGAPINLANALGWTALHEAAFFNQEEIVKLLLVYGADATKRNNQGMLPYHLSSSMEVRKAIEDIGGKDATAEIKIKTMNTDKLQKDAMSLLSNLDTVEKITKKDDDNTAETLAEFHLNENKEADEEDNRRKKPEEDSEEDNNEGQNDLYSVKEQHKSYNKDLSFKSEINNQSVDEKAYINKGGLLGDLPQLGANNYNAHIPGESPLSKKNGKKKTSSPNSRHSKSTNYNGKLRPEFLCELSKRPLKNPVKTPYGNVYEKNMIKAWFARNGSVDPLSGQPLAESQCVEDKELKQKIKLYYNELQETKTVGPAINKKQDRIHESVTIQDHQSNDDDGLYDF